MDYSKDKFLLSAIATATAIDTLALLFWLG